MKRPANIGRQPTQRSAVTNGSKVLAGVNGRTALARRYRDLVEALTEELGGDLGESDRLQVRNAATLQLHAEDLTARMVRGEAVDPEAISRASNGATRALAALRRRKAARKPAKPALAEYLAGRRGQAA